MDDNQKFISHVGVIGMKWGVRRAEKAAARAGKALAQVKAAERGSRRAVSVYNKEAKELSNLATSQKQKGQKIRSLASQTLAEANKERAQETRKEGKQYSNYYKRLADRKTEKAYKLAKKYGDAKTKKRIADIIEKKSKMAMDDIEFDTTDPLVAGLQTIFDGN